MPTPADRALTLSARAETLRRACDRYAQWQRIAASCYREDRPADARKAEASARAELHMYPELSNRFAEV